MIIQTDDTLRILMVAEQLNIDPKLFQLNCFYDAGYDEGEMKFKMIFLRPLDTEELGMMANSPLYKYYAKRYGITPQKYEYVFDYDVFKGTKIIGPNHRRFIHQTEIDL